MSFGTDLSIGVAGQLDDQLKSFCVHGRGFDIRHIDVRSRFSELAEGASYIFSVSCCCQEHILCEPLGPS